MEGGGLFLRLVQNLKELGRIVQPSVHNFKKLFVSILNWPNGTLKVDTHSIQTTELVAGHGDDDCQDLPPLARVTQKLNDGGSLDVSLHSTLFQNFFNFT